MRFPFVQAADDTVQPLHLLLHEPPPLASRGRKLIKVQSMPAGGHLLAQKPSMPAMQIQAMFGTYDPAEYQ